LAETGLSSLKVGYNRVHGYYIEISRRESELAPSHYSRRQTLKNVERFITPELKLLEEKLLASASDALILEKQLYHELVVWLREQVHELLELSHQVAALDVLNSFCRYADQVPTCIPTFSDQAGIEINAGRHPVVEQIQEQDFVPNEVLLSPEQRLHIITGPNMGGKSTYMRQVALITLMAHIGCPVPAEQARFGPVERIFTRIGASDDLASGRSTFMVEMSEAATILHQANEHSLVIIDEMGRGTSTYDGLSLAWACASQLATVNKAYTLFATHYFELTELAERFAGIINRHFSAEDFNGDLVFQHQLKDGATDDSYGVQVADLAGLPDQVLKKAREKLESLEQKRYDSALDYGKPEVGKVPAQSETNSAHPALQAIAALNPDDLSPKTALDEIYRLKAMIEQDG
jgi:DNA mismatch repair protein MutS